MFPTLTYLSERAYRRPASRPHLLSYRALRVVFHFHLDRRRRRRRRRCRRARPPLAGRRINRERSSIGRNAKAGLAKQPRRQRRRRGRILMTLLFVVDDDGKTTAIIVEDRADELAPQASPDPTGPGPARRAAGVIASTSQLDADLIYNYNAADRVHRQRRPPPLVSSQRQIFINVYQLHSVNAARVHFSQKVITRSFIHHN